MHQEPKYRPPKKVTDLIPISCIWEDGIFLCGGRYCLSYEFSDINYMASSHSDKEAFFASYCELLNSLDCGAVFKITIIDRPSGVSDIESTCMMETREDGMDALRDEFNSVILASSSAYASSARLRILTVSISRTGIEQARMYFGRITPELTAKFLSLGSKLRMLNASEKLMLLESFYRPKDNAAALSFEKLMRRGADFKDYICPNIVEKKNDCLIIDGRYFRTLYLKDYASYIKDTMVTEIVEDVPSTMLSVDIIPTPTDEAIREVEKKLLGVETNISNWQRKQNQCNNFSAVIPYDMELQRKESKEFLNDLSTRDQRMMFALLTVGISASSKEELDSYTETVMSTARKYMCQMDILKYQQLDGMNTVLPIGTRKIHALRTLTTESLAVLMPFKVQEIQEKGGIYLGQNSISHNLILCNRENLVNQSAMILGVPGSGKSLCAKNIIWQILLNSDDDVCICDPEGEYSAMLSSLPDEMRSCISMTAGGRDRLNAMYMVDGYGGDESVVVKSQFIMSLIEQIDSTGVGPKHKSVIDRCCSSVYSKFRAEGKTPTLCDLRTELLSQDEDIAKDIALSLELYTEGSLDIFGHESNVDLNRRCLVFDIHSLGSQLKSAALLVITDTILNRVTLNWKNGRRTHVFIDEFHVVFENEYSASFFTSAWRQFRKRNAYPTALTQNVEFLLDKTASSTMLSNSEFVIMLSQAASDRDKLSHLMNISPEQMSYVTNSKPGSGLIRYGSHLVPFENSFPKDTLLYSLMTTRPGEGIFSGAK